MLLFKTEVFVGDFRRDIGSGECFLKSSCLAGPEDPQYIIICIYTYKYICIHIYTYEYICITNILFCYTSPERPYS